ncbi:MAG TPA: plastocyanin/azurin family copper-binding protein [Candidatus Dormibacteraeota bacterium]|nr:plastocyanin/azurin family copper-binding protein [Candidatus Dormibacteraeota bacterium]
MWSIEYSRCSHLARWMVALAILVVLPEAARAQWHATVGAQSPHKGRQALAFLPNELWIHEADSITWKFEAGEIHTVTFLATEPVSQVRPPFPVGCPGFSADPGTFDGSTCVTTPPLVAGATFTVRFPSPGNYKLVCLVHADMTGVVHVLELSKPLPHTQDFYDEEAEAQMRALLSDADREGKKEGHSAHRHSGDPQVIVGGGEISTNAGGASTLSLMRFAEHTLVIHAGQTVEWGSDDPEDPHTITFGTEPAGDPFPPSSNVTVDADGARHAVINSTSDSVHSGFILAAPQERAGLAQSPLSVTRFRVTFTHPGTYPYICALHDDLGMKGEIIVLP